jgi:Right handed beta helix region
MVSVKLARFSDAFVLTIGLLCSSAHAIAQYNQTLYVDCSLTTSPNPQTYTSINAAVLALTDRTAISVASGTVCNESVYLSDFTDVSIYSSMGFILNGNLTIQNSRSVYINGVNVTNPNGDGIDVNYSNAVTIEDSSSSNNSGAGLNISASSVTVIHVDSFDYNLGGGVIAGTNSTVNFSGWWPSGGHFELIGNSGAGLRMDRSVVQFSGSTTISNTVPSVGGTFPDAFGIIGWGGAKGYLLGMTGANSVTNNQGGGIFLGETSELSIGGGFSWANYPVTVQGNGPYGAYLEFGGQLTVFGATQITDHTIAGIDVYSGSEADIYNSNQISHNGTGLDPGRAGLRVDGNSQAYVRGATFSGNGGPGILALVNSSVDLGSSSFAGNLGGAVVCDGSAVLKSDVAPATLASGNSCRIALANGIQHHDPGGPLLSNQTQWKTYIVKMHAYMATHHR